MEHDALYRSFYRFFPFCGVINRFLCCQRWSSWKRDLPNFCSGRICLAERKVYAQLWQFQMPSLIFLVSIKSHFTNVICDLSYFFPAFGHDKSLVIAGKGWFGNPCKQYIKIVCYFNITTIEWTCDIIFFVCWCLQLHCLANFGDWNHYLMKGEQDGGGKWSGSCQWVTT